jgi:cell wall-associated NlpC family hydrolase
MTTPLVAGSMFDVLSRRPSELQNQDPLQQDPNQDQGALDEFDYRPYWQKKAAQRQAAQAQIHEQDRINPMADVLGIDQFANRLMPIRDIGQKALVGEQIAAQMRAERERQAAIVAAEKQRQQAWQDAMNQIYSAGNFGQLNMMQYQQAGQNGSAGWGSGGAQGVANVLRAAGFPESAVPTMMAIAMAESSWRPNATHRNSNGSIDQGLFQINSIHRNNPWYPKDPFDPYQSAVAAYNIWKGAGGTYRDWTVYNSGAYRKFLQAAPPIMKTSANPTVMIGNTAVVGGNGQLRMTAIQKGMNYISSGVGYVWGGNNLATGVDCSGLVQQIYRQLGISLPRTAQQQAFYGTKAPVSQLRPGDLVAWNNGGSRGLQVGHIAIYAGNGEIIESYDSGKPARRRKLSASEVNSGYAWGVKIRFPGE